MQSRHFRSLLLLLVLNLLIKPFWILGIDRNVQLAVGEESYGLYSALFNFSFWLQIILDPGLHTYNNKALAQNPSLLSKYISSFIPLKLGLSVLYFALSLLAGMALGYHFRGIHLLCWMLFNQVLASLILYFRANLAGLHKFNVDSLFSVMDRSLMILFCGLMLWGNFFAGSFRIEWFIYAQSLAYILTAILAFFAVFRYSQFFRPKFNFTFLRVILRESYPYALLSILMTLYTRIDAVMIERMLPNGRIEAGVYAKAYRLLDAINQVALLFGTILLPVFTRMIKQKQPIGRTVNTTFSLLIVPSFLIGLSCFSFRKEIMDLLYHQSTPELQQIFGSLMFTQLAISTVYIYGTLLTANGSLRFLNIVSGLGVLLNVILNVFLIPRYGALGAVIATLGTQSLVSIWQILKAHAIFRFLQLAFREVAKAAAFVFIAIISFHLLGHMIADWAIALAVLWGINLIFAVIFKLIKPGIFLELIKFKDE